MSIYLVLGIIVFMLISKRLFSSFGSQTNDKTPPIFDEKQKKSIFDEIFGDIFNEKGDTNIVKKNINFSGEGKKSPPIIKDKIIQEKQKIVEIKEENDFDIRKAVIYSEILNNPFIDKSL